MEVIKCNKKVVIETIGEARNLNKKSKMAESQDQLKLNEKTKTRLNQYKRG